MIIAVDVAGSDYGPREVVKGALKARMEYGVDVVLVGKKSIINMMAGRSLKDSGLSIVDAGEVITCNESPMRAVRSKPDSSIVVGINLVAKGKADAFVSAGSTGAVFLASLLALGKMEGVERPAIGSVLDVTQTTPVLLIDAGANVDCRPNHLVQFAQLGAIYSENVLRIKSPRVGLLSNGAEAVKGNHLVIGTNKLLSQSGLNFIGNVEGHDIIKGTVDVVVTDGFVGNIVLKTLEGMGDNFQNWMAHIKEVLNTTYQIKGRLLSNLVGLHSWATKLDYREYGGACLLGVNGNVIIVHGRSQAQAIKNAIGLAKQAVERNILQKMQENASQFNRFRSEESSPD